MSVPLERLQAALGSGGYRLVAAERRSLEAEYHLSTDDLLRALVTLVAPRALCPISGFRVGAAGLTAEGDVFLGVNLEFRGASMAQTVHAEQFLVAWVRYAGGSPLVAFAVSAAPCGHCRQFLREFDHRGRLKVLIGQAPEVEVAQLLPEAFTPQDLGIDQPFWSGPLGGEGSEQLEDLARRAAQAAYTPYSQAQAGVAIRLRDGRQFAGCALENAAYNPTLPPLQSALVACHAQGAPLTEIESVALCQRAQSEIDYGPQTWTLAQALGVAPERWQTLDFDQ